MTAFTNWLLKMRPETQKKNCQTEKCEKKAVKTESGKTCEM